MAARSPGGTGGERGIGRSKGRKQKEEKQKKLEIEGEKGAKRVTFKGIERAESMSLTEIVREVRKETEKEIKLVKESLTAKEKEEEAK